MKHYNVLVFPGGSEIGLEIHKALHGCKEIVLFSAAMDTPNHAPYMFKRHFVVPSIHDAGWIESLNKILIENAIDFIYPAYDDIIVALAENADQLAARLVLSPLETCIITRSKSETYKCFASMLPTPTVYDEGAANFEFPVFVKPDRGQGSEGVQLIWSQQELDVARKDGSVIVLEYLPGGEVTVDCFSDREAGLLFCEGRVRQRTKSGISMATEIENDPVFRRYATIITQRLEMHGAWFFQMKKDRFGEYKLLEIAPRIAGAMALNRVRGVNFPLLSIYEQERLPLSIMVNDGVARMERALVNRYSSTYDFGVVYMDLDDTLLLRGQVNIDLIKLIYQCVNKKIPVRLITKHAGDLSATLDRHKLSGIFDRIIHLRQGDCKADYVLESDAIFVDDSFSERRRVFADRGIRTFDSSMIEVLFDDRV